jgi:hypothetical protein
MTQVPSGWMPKNATFVPLLVTNVATAKAALHVTSLTCAPGYCAAAAAIRFGGVQAWRGAVVLVVDELVVELTLELDPAEVSPFEPPHAEKPKTMALTTRAGAILRPSVRTVDGTEVSTVHSSAVPDWT